MKVTSNSELKRQETQKEPKDKKLVLQKNW